MTQVTKQKQNKTTTANHHRGIKCSPFAALLGSDTKIGLTSSSLPHNVTMRLQSGDDLLSAISTPTATIDTPSQISDIETADQTDAGSLRNTSVGPCTPVTPFDTPRLNQPPLRGFKPHTL